MYKSTLFDQTQMYKLCATIYHMYHAIPWFSLTDAKDKTIQQIQLVLIYPPIAGSITTERPPPPPLSLTKRYTDGMRNGEKGRIDEYTRYLRRLNSFN